jgi:hypothetical protein
MVDAHAADACVDQACVWAWLGAGDLWRCRDQGKVRAAQIDIKRRRKEKHATWLVSTRPTPVSIKHARGRGSELTTCALQGNARVEADFP